MNDALSMDAKNRAERYLVRAKREQAILDAEGYPGIAHDYETARAEIARQADVIRAQAEQIADLMAQRERLCDLVREYLAMDDAKLASVRGFNCGAPKLIVARAERARAALAGGGK